MCGREHIVGHALIFLWTPKVRSLHSFQNVFEFFLKPVYCTMVVEKFQLHGVKITYWKMHSWVKKLNLFIFTYVPKQKYLLGSYHYHSRQEEITHFTHTTFFVFFLSRKGGGLWSWKSQVLINSTILAWRFFNLTSLIFTKRYSV